MRALNDESPASVDTDDSYVMGVDYGTLPGRAVVFRVADGTELGSAVLDYATL